MMIALLCKFAKNHWILHLMGEFYGMQINFGESAKIKINHLKNWCAGHFENKNIKRKK